MHLRLSRTLSRAAWPPARRRVASLLRLVAVAAALTACEPSPTEPACRPGQEACQCAAESACLPPLVCDLATDRCVSPPAGPDATEAETVGSDVAPDDAGLVGDLGPASDAPTDDTGGAEDASAEDTAVGEDTTVPGDTAVGEDTTVPEDSAPGEDTTVPEDTAMGEDGTVPEDTAPVEDTAVGEDTAPTGDSAVSQDAGPTDPCEASPRGDGCLCEVHADCASEVCQPRADGTRTCAPPCGEGCPEGTRCGSWPAAEGELPLLRCLVPDLNLCSPCDDDQDCTSGLASDSGARCLRGAPEAGHVCGVACEDDAGCPAGYACRDGLAVDGSAVRQCVLADPGSVCGCSPRAILGAATTSCAVRTCVGTRTCEAPELGPCTDATGVVCPTPSGLAVTFDVQGGEPLDAPVVYVYRGETYGPLPSPFREGYGFEGWWTAPNGAGLQVMAATVVTAEGPHTLFADWTALTFSVVFDTVGGTPCDETFVTFGEPYDLSCSPMREGYTFAGWYIDDGAEGIPVTAASRLALGDDHVLTARWNPNTYEVFLDSLGGSVCPGFTVTFGAPYGLLCAPTRTGYAFDGWYTRADATGTLVTATTTVTSTFNHSLYARWTAVVAPESCTGAFDEDHDGFVDCYDPDCVGRPGCPAGYPDDTCATATTIRGAFWSSTFDTCAYTANYSGTATNGCKTHGSAKDAIVRIVADVAGTYRVSFDTGAAGVGGTGSFDSTLNVVKSVSCPNSFNSCVASSDRGDPERVDIPALAGETFWVLADGYGTRCGVGRLTVTRLEPEQCSDGIDNDDDGLTDCSDISDCNGAIRPAPLQNCPFLDFRCAADVNITSLPFTNNGRNLCNHQSAETFSTTSACKAYVDPSLGGIIYAYRAPVSQKVRVTAIPRSTWYDEFFGESLPIDLLLNLTKQCSPTADPTPCVASSDSPTEDTEVAETTVAANETLYIHVNLANSPYGNDCGNIDLRVEVVP
jgi:uncharacterized repeat protein (TIGR02543 family)